MITFYKDNEENLIKLLKTEKVTDKKYAVVSVFYESSEDNDYILNWAGNEEPTEDLLNKLAKKDYKEFSKGISENSKSEEIKQYLESYKIINIEELFFETRKQNMIASKNGHKSDIFKINLPVPWIKELGFTLKDKAAIITLNRVNKTIEIEKD